MRVLSVDASVFLFQRDGECQNFLFVEIGKRAHETLI